MALANKTMQKAAQLAEAPIEGYFMAARVHPLLAMLPTGVLMVTFLSGLFVLQLISTVVVVFALVLTLGRSVAITADEIVMLQGRPPLWRPAKVLGRLPRQRVPVTATRLYWKVELDGHTYWVNKTFADHVNLISEDPLDGASSKRTSGRRASAAHSSATDEATRERQIIESSRRVTPKGTRNRKPKKYR